MSGAAFKERLRADLKAAMRERNATEVSLLRSLLAAVDNAEAVPVEGMHDHSRASSRDDPQEIARLEIDDAQIDALLAGEITSRLAAAATFERHGRDTDATRMRSEAGLIGRYRA